MSVDRKKTTYMKKYGLSKDRVDLLELVKYLSEGDGKELQSMIKNQEQFSDENCRIFANNAMTDMQVRQTYSFSQNQDMDYKDYVHKLNATEKAFIEKFYAEMYANRIYIPSTERLLNTAEMIKESNRINNARSRDLFAVGAKRGILLNIDDRQLSKHAAIEKNDWEQVYSNYGYEEALAFIIEETIDELKMKGLDQALTLVRFHIKMNRLKKEAGVEKINKILNEFDGSEK